MKQRTKAQLNQLRKLVGGGMAVAGALMLAVMVMLNIFVAPLVVLGLVLLVLGVVVSASPTVFMIIIDILSFW